MPGQKYIYTCRVQFIWENKNIFLHLPCFLWSSELLEILLREWHTYVDITCFMPNCRYPINEGCQGTRSLRIDIVSRNIPVSAAESSISTLQNILSLKGMPQGTTIIQAIEVGSFYLSGQVPFVWSCYKLLPLYPTIKVNREFHYLFITANVLGYHGFIARWLDKILWRIPFGRKFWYGGY